MKRKRIICIMLALISLAACNHTKPVSTDISKTTVAVNGKKDSVINNPQKNYGNATVSEPCIKCLLQLIQKTGNYKKLTAGVPQKQIVYDVNWITSSKPKDLRNGNKVINGMMIDVNEKAGDSTKKVTTYVYNNENAQFYLLKNRNNYVVDAKVSDTTLKKVRNSCFWGVASSK